MTDGLYSSFTEAKGGFSEEVYEHLRKNPLRPEYFWAVAPGVTVSDDVRRALSRAKEMGRPEIPRIAVDEARRLGIDETRCRYYLEHVIRHDFGDEELAGLRRFHRLAVEHGLAPEGVTCVFHGEEHLAKSG